MPYLKKPVKDKEPSISRIERNKIYSTSQWKKLRSGYLIQHPLCELCLKEGKVVPAIDVHHIISFTSYSDPLKRKEIAFNPNNLMSLCKVCHQNVHHCKPFKDE